MLMESQYSDMLVNLNFLEEMAVEQQDMENYINECIIVSSSNNKRKVFSELYAFNEAKFGDKVKGMFTRLKSFFSKIWQKFLEKLNAWAQDNKEYLENYKDIIIGKKVTLANVKMQNHFKGRERIKHVFNQTTTFATPLKFDDSIDGFIDVTKTATDMTNASDEEATDNEYNKFLLSQYSVILKSLGIENEVKIQDSEELGQASSILNNYFNGGEDIETYNTDDIEKNMKIMFNELYSYGEAFDGLTKVKNNYEQGMDKTQKAYDAEFTKISNLLKTKATADKGTDDAAKTKAADAVGAEDAKIKKELEDAKKKSQNAGYIYSDVIGGYISEDGATVSSSSSAGSGTNNAPSTNTAGGDKIDSSGSKSGASAVQKDANAKAAVVKDTGNEVNRTKAAAAAVGDAQQVDTAKLDKFQANAVNVIKAYSTTRTNIFACMLNGLQSMRNDYMTVIRAHVNSHLGQVNNPDKNTTSTSTT